MDIKVSSHGDEVRFSLRGVMSFRDKDLFNPVLEIASRKGGGVVTIDLSELDRVDSFGIGLFLLASEQAVAAGTRLSLVNPQGAVARVFELANLEAVLSLRKSDAPAHAAVQPPRRRGIDFRRLADADDGAQCVALVGRLVFAEHGTFQEIVELLAQASGARVVLDLSELEFMDSAGLSMIMIAREEAEARHQSLMLRNPKGAVAQLLSLSALEFMLEG